MTEPTIEWPDEVPPPPTPTKTVKLKAVAEACKQRPGVWARIVPEEHGMASPPHMVAYTIKNGHASVFRPRGSFEAYPDPNRATGAIYLRYVGEE